MLTLAIVAVTVVISTIVLSSPTALAQLERTPAGLHGQWWRALTSLLTQDSAGGAARRAVLAGLVAYLWRAPVAGPERDPDMPGPDQSPR
ncbi:MAG: hypothetical protein ACRDN0_08490 [Trebonia sp.]